MGVPFHTQIDNWANGVISASEPDLIPRNAAPRALNAAWTSVGEGTSVVSKRRGMALAITALRPTAIGGQAVIRRRSGATITQSHLIAHDTSGELRALAANGSVGSSLGTVVARSLASAQLSNLLFLADGTNRKKFDGTAISEWGFDPPIANFSVTATGSGGMTGDYEIALTSYNSATGHESSRTEESGPVSPLASEQLKIDWTDPSDPQITHVRVYLRKPSISTGFYRVGEVAIGTETLTIDVDDGDYNALILLAPDREENNRPPSGIRFVAVHKNRLFAADHQRVYFSKVGLPESFDPDFFETPNPDDGQKITGLWAEHDVLLIFKQNDVYMLVGDSPSTWEIRLLAKDLGTNAQRSVVSLDGATFWWSERGPVRWTGPGAPVQQIAALWLREVIDPQVVNLGALDRVVTLADAPRHRVIFMVPPTGVTTATIGFPFNTSLGRWEGMWTTFDVASSATIEDTTGVPWVMIGGGNGGVYRLWDDDNDGLPEGTTKETTFTAATATVTTVAGTGFDTAVGLKGLIATLEPVDGTWAQQRGITANSATEITVSPGFTSLDIGALYRVTIGGPAFELDTRWEDDDTIFFKKRYEYAYVQARSSKPQVEVKAEFSRNLEENTPLEMTFTPNSSDSLWGVMLWGEGIWGGGASVIVVRERIGLTGRLWRLRLINRNPDEPFTIGRVAVRGERLTDRG